MPILLAICLFQVEVTAKVTRPSAGAAASWPWSPLAPCPQDAPVRGPTCTTPYIKARAPKPSGPGTEKPRVSARFHRRQIKTPKGSLPVPKRRSPKPLFPRKTRAVHTTSRRGSQTKDRTYTGMVPKCPSVGIKEPWLGPGPTATPGHSALHHRTAAESWASAEALDPEEGGQPINQASAHMVLCQVIFITKRFK